MKHVAPLWGEARGPAGGEARGPAGGEARGSGLKKHCIPRGAVGEHACSVRSSADCPFFLFCSLPNQLVPFVVFPAIIFSVLSSIPNNRMMREWRVMSEWHVISG